MTQHSRGDGRFVQRPLGRLDYGVFVATLQAWQLSTATARAEGCRADCNRDAETKQAPPLTQILLGTRDWQQAVLAQQGSFNPLFARGADQY